MGSYRPSDVNPRSCVPDNPPRRRHAQIGEVQPAAARHHAPASDARCPWTREAPTALGSPSRAERPGQLMRVAAPSAHRVFPVAVWHGSPTSPSMPSVLPLPRAPPKNTRTRARQRAVCGPWLRLPDATVGLVLLRPCLGVCASAGGDHVAHRFAAGGHARSPALPSSARSISLCAASTRVPGGAAGLRAMTWPATRPFHRVRLGDIQRRRPSILPRHLRVRVSS